MAKMKYICTNCGNTFDEDEIGTVMQWDGEGVMGGYHPVEDQCPYCKSTDDIREAEECCCCSEYSDKEDDMVEVDDWWYCKDCARKIHDAYYLKWGRFEEGKK